MNWTAPPFFNLIIWFLCFGFSISQVSADSDVFTLYITSYVDKNGNPVSNPSNPSPTDSGLETLQKAGIGIAVVLLLALIGIFILRKWKFTPTNRFRQKLASAEGIRQRSTESDHVFLRELHAP